METELPQQILEILCVHLSKVQLATQKAIPAKWSSKENKKNPLIMVCLNVHSTKDLYQLI